MIGEEVQHDGFYMIPHTVKLNTLVVVNVQVFLLRNCKHLVILQEADIPNFFLCLKLSDKSFSFPLDHRQVSLASTKQNKFAIPCNI